MKSITSIFKKSLIKKCLENENYKYFIAKRKMTILNENYLIFCNLHI